MNVKDPRGLEQTEQLAEEIAELVVEFGGSLSGEHGDGIVRGAFIEKMFGARMVEAFRETKRLFDPDGLFNPGKIVDTPDFSDNLRLSPATVNVAPPQGLDFTSEGGLARAAELCNGQGACRKFDGGMCPSFQVTQDEEHSTRGRANLLRQILNGALPAEELAGDRLHEALDLCVECKACKAECPSGVDLAKLKYEVLWHRQREHGAPLRDRAFANIAKLAQAGSVAPWLANAASRLPGARRCCIGRGCIGSVRCRGSRVGRLRGGSGGGARLRRCAVGWCSSLTRSRITSIRRSGWRRRGLSRRWGMAWCSSSGRAAAGGRRFRKGCSTRLGSWRG